MEDQRIVDLFYARAEQAIGEVSQKYGTLFARIAGDFLVEEGDVQEAVNDLYMALWNSIPPNRPANLKAYAVRILRNLAVKRYHANTAQKRSSPYDVALEEIAPYLPGGPKPEDMLSVKELGGLINGFLAGLEKQDRIFFVRRYYLAQTPAQIGREMGRTSHYVSVRLHRVREKLRQELVKEGYVL